MEVHRGALRQEAASHKVAERRNKRLKDGLLDENSIAFPWSWEISVRAVQPHKILTEMHNLNERKSCSGRNTTRQGRSNRLPAP